ncbi:acyl-CoA dehydrogenase family protein [Amycolatopsis sp. NPDC023774]|uniref:acyl-CoA dehydrogenase family protein n=1 Tax=Amycolatopsis sp. NPDC023774 TaxID=3155015 RepID=UPI0034052F19
MRQPTRGEYVNHPSQRGLYFTSSEHDQLRAEVRQWAELHVSPRIPQMESLRRVDVALSRLIARQGWIGVTVPPEYGGMGLGHLAKTIIIEELARISGAMGAMVQASQLGTAKILHWGTDEQKRRWLPAIAAGECLPTIATTEKGSGGQVGAIATTARREGDEYVLNGSKVWVGNSHVGDLHGVIVRTGEGSRGLTAFLVEATRPGCTLAPHPEMLGLHGFSFGEIRFDDCRVPIENRIGAEGDGLAVAFSSSVLYGRPNLTAVSLGIHQAAVETTNQYTSEVQRYGNPLSMKETIRNKIAEMQSNLMTARILAYHAADSLDRGLACDAELMNAKLENVKLSKRSVDLAMEIHAAYGLVSAHEVSRLYRDVVHIEPPAGTSDIQRVRLAEVSLGEARPEWSQRFSGELRASTAARERALSAPAEHPVVHAGESASPVPQPVL